MKIALIGYGKMGQTIERIARDRGHDIPLIIDRDNAETLHSAAFRTADVAIEFTGPESAFTNLQACFQTGVPVVCGSTGWLHHYDDAVAACIKHNGALLYASNFSLGVNLFFELNRQLARLMSRYPQYDVHITEVHHTAKLDAPSGTAISLAAQVLASHPSKKRWVNEPTGHPEDLYIESIRQDPAPGTHTVTYPSVIDTISITHEAHSREGFALGAVMAAEFLSGKHGIYSMQDVLGL